MPLTSPYAIAQVSVNGGAPQTGGLTVAGGSTMQLSLTNGSLITNVRWEIYAYPDEWPTPAGWTLDATTGIIYSTDTTPSLITLEAAATRWGKWLVRVIGNGGTKNGVAPVQDPVTGSYLPNDVIDIATGWKVLSPSIGLSELALFEGTQFGGLLRWVKDLRAAFHLIETKSASWGGGGSVAVHAGLTTDYTVTETTGTIRLQFKTFAAAHVLTLPAAPATGMTVSARSEDNTITDVNKLTWTPSGGKQIERANVTAATFDQTLTNSGTNGMMEFYYDGTLWRAAS